MARFISIRHVFVWLWLLLVVAQSVAETKRVPSMQANTFQAGINVLIYRRDYTTLDDLGWKLDILFDRLIDNHINAVSIAWLVYTDGVRANRVFRGEETPTDESIAFFARTAKKRGFTVMLRPLIDEQSIVADGPYEWRGTIRPQNKEAWFTSYTNLIVEYANIAQEAEVDSLVIAAELTSMEKYPQKWKLLIAQVRETFSGKLTYSSNQGVSATMPWDALDFIGVDAFFKLDTPSHNATIEDMSRAMQKSIRKIEGAAKKIGKPLVFTEIGSTSQKNAHKRTWVWDHKTGVDLEDQRRFYAAACAVWKPRLDGIYWWATDLWIPERPLEDKAFTPMGKPAEAEIAACYK